MMTQSLGFPYKTSILKMKTYKKRIKTLKSSGISKTLTVSFTHTKNRKGFFYISNTYKLNKSLESKVTLKSLI